MNKVDEYKFLFNWILVGKLGIGNSPLKEENIEFLKRKKIKNILSLCSESEIEWAPKIEDEFNCGRVYLPDSKSGQLPSFEKLNIAYITLSEYIKDSPTFVHCFASIERSPMICILYIMNKYNMAIEDSLDYVLRKHAPTNPTNNQLKVIKNFKNDFF